MTIAAWWEDRARQLGAEGGVAAAVAARLRQGHPGNERLWRTWGHHDTWWPDWEGEEVLDELLTRAADPDAVIEEAVRWAERLAVHEPADQVARWLKVVARVHEHGAHRGAQSARSLERAALLRRTAAAAREPRHEATCGRLVAARHVTRMRFSPGLALREIADRAEASGPDELLAAMVAAAEAAPLGEEGLLDRTLTAVAWSLVSVYCTVEEAICALAGRLTRRGK